MLADGYDKLNNLSTVVGQVSLIRSVNRSDSRPPANFVADSLGLDFLNSIATPLDTPVDWLDDGEGLLDWLAQAKLVPTDALNALRARATPAELDKVADEARGLREWFRAFVRRHMGRPLAPAALRELGPLNRLLERDETFSRISGGDGGRLELRATRRWRSPEFAARADRRGVGEVRVRGRFRQREGVRGT